MFSPGVLTAMNTLGATAPLGLAWRHQGEVDVAVTGDVSRHHLREIEDVPPGGGQQPEHNGLRDGRLAPPLQ